MRKLFVLGAALVAACGGDDGTGPSGPQGLSVGGSRQLDGAERTTLQLSGGAAGAEYVLIPFYGDSVYEKGYVSNADRTATDTARKRVELLITPTGAEATTGAPNPMLSPATGTALFSLASAGDAGAALSSDPRPDAARHLRMMRRGQREVASVLPQLGLSYRAAQAGGTALRSGTVLATAVVNDILSLNANSDGSCRTPQYRQGRVAAVSERAVVVADLDNPAGGFTDDDYRRFGAQFDTLVYQLDVDNFGAPGDIDQNGGRVAIFFTRAVNEITPPNSSFYVGGFFSARDLLPIASSQGYAGCPGSNYAEMFYMLAPDPAGAVNGNVRTTNFVRGVTIRTLAHEFQHLINFSRRLTNNASYDEDVWLNEGLSHAAEELLFYRVSGAKPGSNLTAAQVVTAGGQYAAAWNEYGKGDLDNLNSYLRNPGGNSPYADNDSIATRGATWQMLRYLVDRKGGTQSATFKLLVNTTAYGMKNLSNVFGQDAMTLVRDWTAAQYADDGGVAGVADALTQPSWNYRDIMPRYVSNNGRFPLPVTSLVAPARVPLVAGGAAYLRFRVPANGTASIATALANGGTVPTTLRLTLLRTQ